MRLYSFCHALLGVMNSQLHYGDAGSEINLKLDVSGYTFNLWCGLTGLEVESITVLSHNGLYV